MIPVEIQLWRNVDHYKSSSDRSDEEMSMGEKDQIQDREEINLA